MVSGITSAHQLDRRDEQNRPAPWLCTGAADASAARRALSVPSTPSAPVKGRHEDRDSHLGTSQHRIAIGWLPTRGGTARRRQGACRRATAMIRHRHQNEAMTPTLAGTRAMTSSGTRGAEGRGGMPRRSVPSCTIGDRPRTAVRRARCRPVCRADALVRGDTENRNRRRRSAHQTHRDAGFCGRARAGATG